MERLYHHPPVSRQHLHHRSEKSEGQTTRRKKAADGREGNRRQPVARVFTAFRTHPGRSRIGGLPARKYKKLPNMKMRLPLDWSAGLRPGTKTSYFQTRRVGDRRSVLNTAFLLGAVCLSALLVSCQTKPSSSEAAPANQPLPVRCLIQRVPNGVQLSSAALNVKVQFYADDIVRVVKWPAGGTSEKASLSVIQKDVPDLNVRFEESPGHHAWLRKGQGSGQQKRRGDSIPRRRPAQSA